ncbi:MAG: nitroreductase family protein [Mariprofundaceae bacterium]|nr:nitroreductase family protein [Mariprofundaceae bacterium]
MNVCAALKTRKSVRAFVDKPIEHEVIEKLLDAALGIDHKDKQRRANIPISSNRRWAIQMTQSCSAAWRWVMRIRTRR